MTPRRRISADTLLPACPEKRIGIALPAPISERLDDLVEVVEASGERTNRKEVLASLILAAPTAGTEISALVRTYRQTAARGARLDGGTDQPTLFIRSHPPGPRPRRRG